MKKYSDRLREYEIKKSDLVITCNDPVELQKKLKELAKELKI